MTPWSGIFLRMFVLAGLAGAATAQERGALSLVLRTEDSATAAPAETVEIYARSYALVIGNNAYQGGGWPRLSNAVKDAREIEAALTRHGFKVTLKLDLAADALSKAIEDFIYGPGADKDARLLIWFAGHGHTLNEEGYLVPVDAPAGTAGAVFLRKALSLRRFGEYLRNTQSRHVLAVFDSCFSGSVFETARAAPPMAITRATTLPVRQMISSGEASQQVSDNGDFRKLFIDALDGKEPNADANRDGYVTGTELGLFLTDKVTNLTRNTQTPRYGKLRQLGLDRGDFVFRIAPLALPPLPAPPVVSPKAPGPPTAFALEAEAERNWPKVQNSTSTGALDAFIQRYAGTFHSDLAKVRLAEVKQAEAARQAVDSAKKKSDDDARAKADQERQRIAMLDQQRQDEARKTAEADAARRSAETTSAMRPGRVFRDCSDGCPEMVVVPDGKFMMGEGSSAREVTIKQAFAVGKFEVTFDEWAACVAGGGCTSNRNPSDEGWGKGRRPVINVSWNDAKEYVGWLSRKTGQTYRLLAEAEWEYAARAGTTTQFSWGKDIGKGNANCDGCGSQWDNKQTAPVGSFKANPWGLHDMHGNVWEWCEDAYSSSSSRVVRGGSWLNDPDILRSSGRYWIVPVFRNLYIGFRVARVLSPARTL